LGTYRTHRAACPQGPTFCTYGVRVPASGVGVRTACCGHPGANQEGSAVLSGHLDHRIYRFYFDPSQQRGGTAHWELCRHSCVPYALSWGMAVCVAGNDQVISFYHKDYQP